MQDSGPIFSPGKEGELLRIFEQIAKIVAPERYFADETSYPESGKRLDTIIEEIDETESEIVPEDRERALSQNKKFIEEGNPSPKRSASNPRF